MRPARALLAAFALLAAVLPAGADAVALPHELVITGSRTSYAVLTVTQETTYWIDHRAQATYAGGRWAGFAIGDDWPRMWTEYYPTGATMHGWAAEGDKTTGARGVLYPGRQYRVYLFTDGQDVTIRLPWTGPAVTVQPDAPLDARVGLAQAVVTPTGTARVVIPQDGTRGTVTAALVRLRRAEPTAYTGRACYARPPASLRTCNRSLGTRTFSDTVASAGVSDLELGGVLPRPLLSNGHDFYVEVAGMAMGTVTALTVRYRPHPEDGHWNIHP